MSNERSVSTSRKSGAGTSLAAAVLLLLSPGRALTQTIDYQPIFEDSFESGGLTAWDAVANPGSDLVVSANAAIDGTWGLEATVDDTDGLYVQDDSPADDAYYRATFSFDPNGFDPGESQNRFRTRILIAFEEGPNRRLFAVVLRRLAGQYALMGRARQDDNSQASTGFVDITDAFHRVTLYWKRASTPDASDGQFEMRIDNTAPQTLANLDNHASGLDFARMGALSVKIGAAGTMYWDDFNSSRNMTAARQQLVVNEMDYDQPGTDTDEFIEIYNRGPANVSLDGVGLSLFDGADPLTPVLYRGVALGPGTLAAGQYLVAARAGFPVPPAAVHVPIPGPQDLIQDGTADGLALVHLPACETMDALVYEGDMAGVEFGCGAFIGLHPLEPSTADSDSVAGSLGRHPNGSDTGDATVDWVFTTTPTPGAANIVTP